MSNRVLLLSWEYPPVIEGGLARHVRKLAEALVASRDTRILYLISNAQIVSSVVKPWIWRRYNGVNPHRHHMHISVVPEPHRYDDIRPWDLSALELKEDADATSPQTPDASSVPASAGR